jgi:hypothetical protein
VAPNYTKTIICLANSRKVAGRCIAGKEIAEGRIGEWIRPVSARPNGEISEEERRYENGTDPAVLDVVTIALIEPRPHGFQVENHLIDSVYYWAKERMASPEEIEGALDIVHGPLWSNLSSSYTGLHDRIEEGQAETLGNSLKLVKVSDLSVSVGMEGTESRSGRYGASSRLTEFDIAWRLPTPGQSESIWPARTAPTMSATPSCASASESHIKATHTS